jgi:polyisoprenyl-teichoic acid--peptidoglycan teichoic acid transferase
MLLRSITRLFLLLIFALSVGLVPAQSQEAPPTWDGESRFTVLVMGMDRRPTDRDPFQTRTDAIILLSIDPANERIGMLHIPRDLHLTPPDSPYFVRVNTLLQQGEDLQEGYGPYYVMDTLQYNLGIYIDRYMLFDFTAFEAIVDAMGGVEIELSYIINDPTYPDRGRGYDPFYLSAGTHTLDGYDALRFARTRHGDNDYVRGMRQMQVARAIYQRASNPDVFEQLVDNAPQLLEDLEDNVYTDLSLRQIIALARAARQLDAEDIVTGSINEANIRSHRQVGDGLIKIPDRRTLTDRMIEVFGENYGG